MGDENEDEINLDEAEAALSAWLASQSLDGARQQRFETLVAKRILKCIGVSSSELKNNLTLAAVSELFDFPLYLVARKLPYIQEITVPYILGRKFAKSKLARTFFEVWETRPAEWDGAVGLIFQWPGLEGDYGIIVMHNLPSDLFSGFGKVVRRFDFNGETFDVTIETLESLLTSLYGPRDRTSN